MVTLLPSAIQSYIVEFMSDEDLPQLTLCKQECFFSQGFDENLWKRRVIKYLGKESAEDHYSTNTKSWKFSYLSLRKLGFVLPPLNDTMFRTRYYGNLINGKIHGPGVLMEDGRMIKGIFNEGVVTAKELESSENLTQDEGSPIRRRMIFQNFDFSSFSGIFSENTFLQGKKISTISGTEDIGNFENDELVGKGIRFYWDISHYIKREEGAFLAGKLDGIGKRIYLNGTIEEGEFYKGLLIISRETPSSSNSSTSSSSLSTDHPHLA